MIELKEVTKQFDDFKVLDKISLTIPKGAAFGLLGSNGAGKSTILRLISGIYSAEEGEVTAVSYTHLQGFQRKKGKICFFR